MADEDGHVTMKTLMAAGISQHIAMHCPDLECFLVASEVLLTRDTMSKEFASAQWDVAAQRYQDVAPGLVTSREKLIRVREAHTIAIPDVWISVLQRFEASEECLDNIERLLQGERFFGLFDAAADFASLLFCSSLTASTPSAKSARAALMLKISETAARIGAAHPIFNQLVAYGDPQSYLSDKLDVRFQELVANLGHLKMAGRNVSMPSFENALAASGTIREWRDFVEQPIGGVSRNVYVVRVGDYGS
mmetsp:Transcript_5898/g.9735  ORF Transcript_5898/g.9735 Transcript_5898/m.9735 type:complete len:249 (-) Transcript_5898:69-815(-)|eukprot:CAMPEP_0206161930 /NCGR_PEP_ID=MMETSP1474-20131121/8894_1 /ASSEMBLY_ACC=CAM_ASM_001110 /TAXON_ID=97495 /ORGANISM="Imantonia sp., Strain RCC918" /LENGTH=248 /DNA_ID=CAMNT_0053564017 /DNA_START=49 /DNA_END=795 /DNA_ORIENTATION=+